MKHCSLTAISTAALLLAGCDLTRPSTPLQIGEDRVAVYSMLRAGAVDASVLVVRFSRDLQGFEEGWRPVAGAAVTLSTPTETLVLRADTTASSARCAVPLTAGFPEPTVRAGCYGAPVPGRVRAGGRYLLTIELPSGERVTGEATVPEPLRVLQPEVSDSFPVYERSAGNTAAVPVRWSSARLPARVEAGLVADSADCRLPLDPKVINGNFVSLNVAHGDSALLAVYGAGCSRNGQLIKWSSIPATLTLAVYDSAYAEYATTIGSDQVEDARASAGLRGALGVFAGVARTDVPIVFVRAPAR